MGEPLAPSDYRLNAFLIRVDEVDKGLDVVPVSQSCVLFAHFKPRDPFRIVLLWRGKHSVPVGGFHSLWLLAMQAEPITHLTIRNRLTDHFHEFLGIHPRSFEPQTVETFAEIRLVIRMKFTGQMQPEFVHKSRQVHPTAHRLTWATGINQFVHARRIGMPRSPVNEWQMAATRPDRSARLVAGLGLCLPLSLVAPKAAERRRSWASLGPVSGSTRLASTHVPDLSTVSGMSIADIRREYNLAGLRRRDLDSDAIAQFRRWFDQATGTRASGRLRKLLITVYKSLFMIRGVEQLDLNAMTLATADRQGRPSARIVLLKGLDERGFIFFTNYNSRKGHELEENPQAALVFHWPEQERQVCVAGQVSKLSAAESGSYFRSRPRGAGLEPGLPTKALSCEIELTWRASGSKSNNAFPARRSPALRTGAVRLKPRAPGVLARTTEPSSRPLPIYTRARWHMENRTSIAVSERSAET